jgi:flagellar L-ring protein precursor FlgH
MKIRLLITMTALAAAGVSALAEPVADWSLATRLYGDKKARRVGDILTVLIVEEATSSKDAQKGTDKKFSTSGKLTFASPVVDGIPQASWTNAGIPAWSVDATRSFSGKGSMENKDAFSGTIGARVMEVLPNGNLMIEGRRTLVIQNEAVEIVLTGTVRPEDISRENTIKSTAVADAAIQYNSTGSIAKNQNKGIFPMLWDWINPF